MSANGQAALVGIILGLVVSLGAIFVALRWDDLWGGWQRARPVPAPKFCRQCGGRVIEVEFVGHRWFDPETGEEHRPRFMGWECEHYHDRDNTWHVMSEHPLWSWCRHRDLERSAPRIEDAS